jgi:hypothetical protein
MILDVYNQLPEATPETVKEMGVKYAEIFGLAVNLIFGLAVNLHLFEQVVERLIDNETHQIHGGESLAARAWRLYRLEQNPGLLVFQNNNLEVMISTPGIVWTTLKVTGHETTLADYREFIASLIIKHGADTRFCLTSDRGDEYFNLRVPGGQ